MNRFKSIVLTGLFSIMVAAPIFTAIAPQPVSAAASIADCQKRVLGIPPWYRGLIKNKECNLKSPNDAGVGGLSGFIWRIVLNGIEMAIVIIAYIAVFFIIYGGFQFMTGGSNPGMVEKARKTIMNACIGLVVAMASIGIVNLIFTIIP